MNNNPIICDPDSEEAKALIGQECEFSYLYTLLKDGKSEHGILIKINNKEIAPFYVKSGNCYPFIRKAEEKLSDRLDKWSRRFKDDEEWRDEVKKSCIINEAIEKLRELGE